MCILGSERSGEQSQSTLVPGFPGAALCPIRRGSVLEVYMRKRSDGVLGGPSGSTRRSRGISRDAQEVPGGPQEMPRRCRS